ncbi:pleckstrin domain-containing protein [Cavenderia fasciculata]|uniref:Pleckstrin domain-containing protein n=1 Tax=Cavenderia fasciculata TaxID=261658 RepID=F4PN62_CACFS|nr:pleckstrin domain-containing protein [Cavenderia fasciculata]EGG23752.1 pleckstrin domain-containing protein [Cavenderia fasciculata]|eukprot:XP_004361603.1 pleckstrin domain-containing protein [Cavenderia fasciculata]
MSIVFDASLDAQVGQFLGDVDDLVDAQYKNAGKAEKLISLVSSKERPVKENSIAFLAFANQLPQNKDAAREAGLIPVFLGLLSEPTLAESVSMVKHASMGLMFLANHSDVNKQAIEQAGGLEKIFDVLRYLLAYLKATDVKKEDVINTVSHTLNLVIIMASLAPIREKMGAVPYFIVLQNYLTYQNESVDVQNQIVEKALSAVNNVCLHKENKDNARVAGCIEAVMQLFKSSKVQIVDSAIRMIYNMTIIDANREAIRRCNGLESLVSILNQQDAIRLIALKAISNMAVDRQTIEYVMQNKDTVLQPILDLFPLDKNEQIFDQVLVVLQNLVSEDSLIEEVSRTGILSKIIPSIKGMPLQNTTQQSILLKSSCIISGLVTIEDVQQSAINEGIIEILIDLIKYQSVDIRKEAARSLANATPYYDDVRGEVGKLGGVPLCLDLLLSSDKEVVKQAARALVNLARNTQNEEMIYEAKGLEHSIRLISQGEKDLKMLGTKLLVNLSLNEKARISFCQKGGLTIVLGLLTSPDQELQLQGTKIATNLAISGRNRKLINESMPDFVPAVQRLVQSSSAEIKTQAEVAISNLSFPYEKSYEGLDFGLEEVPEFQVSQSFYEHEEDDDEDEEDKEAAQQQRIQEEEEMRVAAENEIQERKRIMEEEVKRIEQRRKQEEERRAKEEEERKVEETRKQEEERLKQLQEDMERVRLEEEEKKRVLEEERKRQEEEDRLVAAAQHLAEQEKAAATKEAHDRQLRLAKEDEERKKKEDEEKKRREEEDKKKKDEEERKKREQEEAAKKAREEEERRIQQEEEDKLKLMQQEILAREEDVKRKKEEEEHRRKKEEEQRRLAEEQRRAQEAQDKASQEAAKAAQEASRAQKRTHIVQEIVQVEVNYVRNLGLIVKKFLNPLTSAAASKRPILTADKIKAIFSIVEIIHNFNSMLADGLQSRVKRWLADNKKDHLLIGDIFFKTTDFMTVYSTYINNYNNAIKTYKESRANNVPFVQFIRKVEADPELRDQELENLLITPVQQLPRYVMLLSDLIKTTNEDHPDYKSLVVALDKIKGVTSYVNERKRDAEDAMTMISIHQNLHGKLPNNFLAPHRKFVKEGTIQFGSSSGSFKDKDPVVFLFTDMLMMTIKHPNKPNEYKYRYSVMLTSSTTVEDFPRINNGFLVKGAQWWMFSCTSAQEKQQWVESINKCITLLPKSSPSSSTTSVPSK